jgi:DNA-binding Lrp family transcriptional regulator
MKTLLGGEDMSGWWDELDEALLRVLREGGPMTPAEVGRRLGLSETAVASASAMLAVEGKLRIGALEALDAGP